MEGVGRGGGGGGEVKPKRIHCNLRTVSKLCSQIIYTQSLAIAIFKCASQKIISCKDDGNIPPHPFYWRLNAGDMLKIHNFYLFSKSVKDVH